MSCLLFVSVLTSGASGTFQKDGLIQAGFPPMPETFRPEVQRLGLSPSRR